MWWPYQLGIEWLVWRYRFASTLHWNAPIQVLMGMAVHSSCNWLSGWCDQHYSMVLRSWYTNQGGWGPYSVHRCFSGLSLIAYWLHQDILRRPLTACVVIGWPTVQLCGTLSIPANVLHFINKYNNTFSQILLDSSLTWTKRTVDKLQVRAIYWIYGHYVKLEVLMWVFGLAKLTVSCHSGQSPTLSVRYFATNTCHQFVLKQCK